MRKIYNLKKSLMLAVALLTSSMAFAQLTETQATATGADKNIDAVGISYTLPGTYIAGKGSTQAGTMTSKGLKLRTKQEGGKIVFNVNKGYTIVKIVIDATGNYAADDNSLPYVKATEVLVDGTNVDFEGGQFPEKGSGISALLTIDNIKATQQVEIMLDNSNASAGTQINACYEVTYEEAAAAEPTITLKPDTVSLVPGATYQIMATIVPASFTESCVWYAGSLEDFMEAGGVSPENDVVELAENGLITAKSAGTIPVKLTWIENPGGVEDTTVVIVNDFVAAEHKVVKTWDFTAMGDVMLTIGGESYQIWNDANNQCNGAQFCSNEGLEQLAFQAVINESNKKGWQIVDSLGLYLTGAGRCAGLGKLKTGQYVEIVYTGTKFVSKDYTMDLKLGPDAGAAKKVISEELNHAIYQMQDKEGATEDLMMGFEINTGNYIKSITIYDEAADPTAIQDVDSADKPASGNVYNLLGIKVAGNQKGLLIKDGKVFIAK